MRETVRLIVDSLVRRMGSVAVFDGHHPASGEGLRFAVEARAADTLAEALGSGEDVLADVEEWQLLGWPEGR